MSASAADFALWAGERILPTDVAELPADSVRGPSSFRRSRPGLRALHASVQAPHHLIYGTRSLPITSRGTLPSLRRRPAASVRPRQAGFLDAEYARRPRRHTRRRRFRRTAAAAPHGYRPRRA
eukprot:111898-Pleurochrysis_carterae.AAC.1